MRREYPVATAPGSDIVGLMAALMMFSLWSAPAALQNKKPLPLKNRKGWNGHWWLFLPSTVLTVSGSRGHRRLPICDYRLPIEFNCSNRQSEIGNRQCPDSQPRSSQIEAPPKRI